MKDGRVGRYRLIDRMAVGGMAEIFLARQTGFEGFEKLVVLKRLRPELVAQPGFLALFLNEARLSAQLGHSNIAQIYDLGRHGDGWFIAMEYVFGRDLRRAAVKAESKGVVIPLVYAVKIAAEVCAALGYAHRKTDFYGRPLGIVHRDVSPENVVVSFEGTVKVLDFGIAKASGAVETTRAGEVRGKLSYMSPEQCRAEPLDGRSDLFSLGACLYEWLTGHKLFTGETAAGVMEAVTTGRLWRPSYFVPDIPPALEAIVMKALERDVRRRYQTATDFQLDLDRFLAGHEFNPSSIHLANFMRQLFADELEDELARMHERGRLLDDRRLDLSLDLGPATLDALEREAGRQGIDAARVVRGLVESRFGGP
jgi:serine/threonine-protein kinase